jgi:hypothetical protein
MPCVRPVGCACAVIVATRRTLRAPDERGRSQLPGGRFRGWKDLCYGDVRQRQKVGDDYQGSIVTLSVQQKGVRIVPEEDRSND